MPIKIKCVTECKVHYVGPFGVSETYGTGEDCIIGEYYYGSRSINSKGERKYNNISKDLKKLDEPTHRQDSFMGIYPIENCIEE